MINIEFTFDTNEGEVVFNRYFTEDADLFYQIDWAYGYISRFYSKVQMITFGTKGVK